MNKTMIALLLILCSAISMQYSYSTISICIGTTCGEPIYLYAYTDYFQCYDVGESDGYEICRYGEKSYFCVAMGDKNKQCVVIE